MSSNQSKIKYSTNVKQAVATPSKIIGQLFDYYKGREYSLVQLCYKHGISRIEIAEALGIDPTLVSRNYPQGGK